MGGNGGEWIATVLDRHHLLGFFCFGVFSPKESGRSFLLAKSEGVDLCNNCIKGMRVCGDEERRGRGVWFSGSELKEETSVRLPALRNQFGPVEVGWYVYLLSIIRCGAIFLKIRSKGVSEAH